MHPLSVLIPTYNEETNIRPCIESVRWADEVVVLDSFSTDTTVEIAQTLADRVVHHEYVNSATQKNWALDTGILSNEWVLIVDADERVSPELGAEIRQVLQDPQDTSGYYINRLNHFLGEPMRRCGWFPCHLMRLFRQSRGRYEDRQVHARVRLEGEAGWLRHLLLHYGYTDLDMIEQKFRRYTTYEAVEMHRRRANGLQVDWRGLLTGRPMALKTALKDAWAFMPFRPAIRFAYMYLWHAGILAGKRGLMLSEVMYAYQVLADVKLMALSGQEGNPGGAPVSPAVPCAGEADAHVEP